MGSPSDTFSLLFPQGPQPHRPRCAFSLVEMMRFEQMLDDVCVEDARLFPQAAEPLRAVAEHARAVEPYLRAIAAARGIKPSQPDALPEGDPLLILRQDLAVVDELCCSASDEGDVGLSSFCGSWLSRRRALVDAVAVALGRGQAADASRLCPL